MPLVQVIVLAIVQGLTEFLPISSTAHLYLTSWLLGWKVESLTFDIALRLGTAGGVFCVTGQVVAQGGVRPDLHHRRVFPAARRTGAAGP